jgi:RNA recognition motif-containing protein
VEQVITVFESCRISVSNLVTSVSDEELRTMAEPFGTIISAHVLPGPTKTGLVTFPSPFEASHAVKSLDGTMVRSKKISARLELHSANSGVPTLRNSTVKLSWFTPTRIAWAHYSAVTLAKRKAADLNGKTFDDRKLTVIFQQPSYHQRESFSIVIKGLPPAAKLEHLKKFFGTNNIKLGEPNYSAFTGRKKVREILETFGELEAFDILPRQGADAKFKALARFKTSEAAVSATSALHGKQQTSLGQCPLWLELVLSLKYTVPLQQYNYQKTQFDQIRLSQSDEGSHAKLAVYDEDEEGKKVDPVCIRIYGDNAKALSKIKVTVDKLIAGQKLMDGGKIVWDDYLDTPASQIFLARVIKETGVFVKKDSRQRTLFLYGAPDANALARPLIQDELKRRKDDETVIPLDASMLRYLLTKGMEQLTAEAGLDSVPSLNVVTRELAVRGSDESRRLVQFSLRSQSLALDAGHEDATQDDSDCPVCMCSPTNGVDLPCGHKYCYTCLKFFLARAADVKVFPIACLAAEGQCGGTVSLETIRDFLSPAEEENLLNTAFLAYIHEHPTDFRYCPTPDCPQIYRPGAEGTVLQCPSCVARICPACHVPYHEGLSCVEQRDGIDSDRLFKEWSDAHGAKACPSCSAVIQKSEGCNHMTCSVCKTHICWVCMGTFPKEIIYNHMTQKHGGIGLRLERFM